MIPNDGSVFPASDLVDVEELFEPYPPGVCEMLIGWLPGDPRPMVFVSNDRTPIHQVKNPTP
jgi:hypothetical protein